MSTPVIDRQLANEVARQKMLAIKHRVRVNWTIGAAFIAGIVVGAGVWFLQGPRDRAEDGGLPFLLGGITIPVTILLGFFLIPRPAAVCPQCQHAWGQEGELDWLTWNCCPGCGLKMSDDTCRETIRP